MKNKRSSLIVSGVVLMVLILGLVLGYNSLVKSETAVESQWATVESKLQRRVDLVPNLVNAVKGSMAQEEAIFIKIAEARIAVNNAINVNEAGKANAQLDESVSRLMVTMEAYPELKSSENVQTLMTQLEGSENRISVERDRYNKAVEGYNVSLKKFPTSLLGKLTGFKKMDFFKAEANAATVPEVDLSDK